MSDVVYINVSRLPRKAREMMCGALEGVGLCSRKLYLDRLDPEIRKELSQVIREARDSDPNTYAVSYDLAWKIMYGRIIKVTSGRGGTRNSAEYLNKLYVERRLYLRSLSLPREIREETEYLLHKFESWKRGYRPGRQPGIESVKK